MSRRKSRVVPMEDKARVEPLVDSTPPQVGMVLDDDIFEASQEAETLTRENIIGFYLNRHDRQEPRPATGDSAGMDIRASLVPGDDIHFYNNLNQAHTRAVKSDGAMYINPGERVLVPTGLFADIPQGMWLGVYSRSGLSLKSGLILTNGVGVVDSDYTDEIKVSLTNVSGIRVKLEDGDRIAQLIPHAQVSYQTERLKKKPNPKGTRNGGFGSTGVK